METFITENFLLTNPTAVNLYHQFAASQPIIDYHCHLSPEDIAKDKRWENLTQIWLNGDHYKWRAMRANGISEDRITGTSSDWEKFEAWAATVPKTIRNPLYHWSHMELKKPFGISDTLLHAGTAGEIWERCNALLKSDDFSARGIMKQSNVQLVVTTDDPTDALEFHSQIRADNCCTVTVLPAFRPDKAMAVENPSEFIRWVKKLESAAGMNISTYGDFRDAIRKRHSFFHEMGCRASDHGIETVYADDYTEAGITAIFAKVYSGKHLEEKEIVQFKSAMLYEFGIMDYERGWVQQYHIGALRNVNTRMFRSLGPDTGYDTIGDSAIARPLSKLLSRLDDQNTLAKTILYNLNPRDNDVMASLTGCFQDGSSAGKIQYGSSWWFLDQKDGIENQLNSLSHLGLLSHFIGMLTDSRSFLSYPRHEYFRRILCNMLGTEMEHGLIPNDVNMIGQMVSDISYANVKKYFGFTIRNSTVKDPVKNTITETIQNN